jgi:hypothetical protein
MRRGPEFPIAPYPHRSGIVRRGTEFLNPRLNVQLRQKFLRIQINIPDEDKEIIRMSQ